MCYEPGVGFFDFRCPISGLSLRGQSAVHIALIEAAPERWAPLSLPTKGAYDRLGSVDFITPDELTATLVTGFARMARAGRVDASGEPRRYAEFTSAPQLERLLKLFAQVNTDSMYAPPTTFTLDGRALRQVLLHAGVVAALAPVAAPAGPPTYEELEEQLGRAPLAPQGRELYEELVIADDPARLRAGVALAQLGALDRRLAAGGWRWSPAAQTGQYDCEVDLEFAREARARTGDFPELRELIARTIARLEVEREEEAERERAWARGRLI